MNIYYKPQQQSVKSRDTFYYYVLRIMYHWPLTFCQLEWSMYESCYLDFSGDWCFEEKKTNINPITNKIK